MHISHDLSLKKFNTFGIDVKASELIEVFTEDELLHVLEEHGRDGRPLLFMGGFSNVLFTKDFEGSIVRISLKGIAVVSEDDDFVSIRAAAGEVWDDFVGTCVDNGWGGIENLSLIPGNVGTCPVQNIGAYGVEIRDVMTDLEAVNIKTLEKRVFTSDECRFGYRDSIFKQELKGKYVILNVGFRLSRKPVLKLDYGNIREELDRMKVVNPGLNSVREAVMNIRKQKLPDPAITGNAGSFFKNPVISREQFTELAAANPCIVSYPQGGRVKLAAAWMIEQCGWKGYREGDAGVHKDQPLVLINFGNATGPEILGLAKKIQVSVMEKFGIWLEMEVNVIG
jgi:UDP-N-acetylmuramate dehydrogenase